jgi:predicted Zn-dependent protease
VTYTHPALGFRLELPEGYEVRTDAGALAMIAVEPGPAPASGFRANLVVTVEEVAAGTAVEDYTESSLRGQQELLSAHRLIDSEVTDVRAATRTLAHHAQDALAVTIEQWRVVARTLAYTVTASCATLDYAAVADAHRDAAESLVPG